MKDKFWKKSYSRFKRKNKQAQLKYELSICPVFIARIVLGTNFQPSEWAKMQNFKKMQTFSKNFIVSIV